MLTRRIGALIAVCAVVAAPAHAQTPTEQASLSSTMLPSSIDDLRAELTAQRERIQRLEDALRESRASLDALAARLGAASEPAPRAVVDGGPKPAPDVTTAPRFDFYADTLVRLSSLHQGYEGCVGCPDRTIGRFRLRFGAEGRLASGARAVFGLSAGELNDPNSVYQTFGGNLGRKIATWDRMYLVVNPPHAQWLELQAGKFPYPWLRSSMTFDVDFYPEGASEKATMKLRAGPLRAVSVQGFQVVVNEQANAPDMLVLGGQSQAAFASGAFSGHVSLTGVDIRRPDLILRSQLDGTNVGVRNTNAVVTDGGVVRYASGFRYVNLIVDGSLRTRWPALPVNAAIELHRNMRAISNLDGARSLRLDVGRQTNAHEWAFSYHVFRVEQDAIVSAMGESDWRTPSNVLQHRFGVNVMLQDHLQALFTWYRGRTLASGLPGAVLIPGWSAGRTEPYADRVYFDLAYRF